MDMKRVEDIEISLGYVKQYGSLPGRWSQNIDELIQTIKQQQEKNEQQHELLKQLVGEETLFQQGEYKTEMTRLYKKVEQQHTLMERYKEALREINDSDETDVFAYAEMCERVAHRALEGGGG